MQGGINELDELDSTTLLLYKRWGLAVS